MQKNELIKKNEKQSKQETFMFIPSHKSTEINYIECFAKGYKIKKN